MSFKTLLLLALLGTGFVVVARAEPPLSPAALAAGDTASAQVSMLERLRYTVGSVGSAIIGSSVRKSALENQENLAELRAALHAAKGNEGMRTRSMARKINYMDSLAVQNLYYGRPIRAMKQSMEAKSLLNDVRRNLMLLGA
ncbi:MAG TPA: hypothetical protein VFO52_05625 [Longimicrobiales bacterium]|nr:hypothetical protein [Longimicrobiales bacterium]